MEAVSEHGSIDLSREKTIEEVLGGYTYFRDGDVLVAKITPCFENGKGAIAKNLTGGIGFGTTELHVLRPLPNIDRIFLYYLTVSDRFRKLGEASMYGAGGQKRISEQFVGEYRTPLPSVETQRAIASFLDRETAKIDALIAKKQRLLDLLEEKRTALITRAVNRGLDPYVPIKDSGVEWIGEIPEHWEVAHVRRLVSKIEQGWSPECDNRLAEGDEWGVVKAGCVNRGVFSESEHKALPAGERPRPELAVQAGDVLMSRASGSPKLVGSIAFVERCSKQLMISDKIFRLHSKRNLIHPEFLALALGAGPARTQIELAISGAGGLANNLPQTNVKALVVALPPKDEQILILASVRDEQANLSRIADSSRHAITLLEEYRAALISGAVAGQIGVGEKALA